MLTQSPGFSISDWSKTVSAWKKQLLEGAPGLFADARTRVANGAAEEELYEQIGRLKMEVEWLKKKSAQLG